MTRLDPALASLAETLAAVVRDQDAERLRGILSGRELPAVGGDEEPADLVRRALASSGADARFLRQLADVLANVVAAEEAALDRAKQPITPSRRNTLLNAFQLAADLPAQRILFDMLFSLLGRLRALPAAGAEGLSLPLWQALAVQQVDASLTAEWLTLLRQAGEEQWTTTRRNLVLQAWRGILLIPPAAEREHVGNVADLPRIQRALETLATAVTGRDGALRFIESALAILFEMYPRSASFWEERLRLDSPPILRELSLRSYRGGDPLTSGEGQREVGAVSTRGVRERIKEIIGTIANLDPELIKDNASLTEDLRLDSLSLLEIAVDVDIAFHLKLPDEQYEGISTLQQLVELVMTREAERSERTSTSRIAAG